MTSNTVDVLVAQPNTPVIDCSYRMAPENPFPAALNDVEDAVKYVLSRPEEYDASHFSIGGFSAGGNLSLAASACLFPSDNFRSLIAFYPVLDLSSPATSKVAPSPNGMPIPVPLACSIAAMCRQPLINGIHASRPGLRSSVPTTHAHVDG